MCCPARMLGQGESWAKSSEGGRRAQSVQKTRKSDPATSSPGVGSTEAGNLCRFLSPFGLFQWAGNSRWTQALSLQFTHLTLVHTVTSKKYGQHLPWLDKKRCGTGRRSEKIQARLDVLKTCHNILIWHHHTGSGDWRRPLGS